MPKIPVLDPIEYLVSKKFPNLKVLEFPAALLGPGRGGLPEDERQRLLRTVAEYRAALKSKSPDELQALVDQERAKDREVWRQKAEQEERERFFNQPHANADYSHWSKAVYWTLEEALALSFGKSPGVVNWLTVKPYLATSPFAARYARVRDLAIRAKNWKQLFDPVAPGIFLAWAKRNEIELPDDLVKSVVARGVVVADWQDLYEKLKTQRDAVAADRDKALAACQKLIDERDGLNRRIAELDELASAWQFDDSAENYPSELDLAMQAWWAVSKNRNPAVTVKQQLIAWLDEHYPKITEEAKERIATVCNWGKRGGRPAQN